MTLIDNPKRLRFMHPAAAHATYINAIKSAVEKATPETADATTIDAAATAIAIARFNTPNRTAWLAATGAILAYVNKKDNDPAIVASTHAKLKELLEEKLDTMPDLSPEVQKRVEALKELQRQHDELVAKMWEEMGEISKMWEEMAEIEKQDSELDARNSEVYAVEAKYKKRLDPLYEERCIIVAGDSDQDYEGEEKGVPCFWLLAMKSDRELDREMTPRDAKAMMYLKDIKVAKTDDGKAMKFEFFFDPNPFFKNHVLTKTHYHSIVGGRIIIHKATGTEIEWYPGKCLTKKERGKRKTSSGNCKSFFNFFMTQEGEESTRNLYICDTLRVNIIPYAVTCFLDPRRIVDVIQSLGRKCWCHGGNPVL